MLAYFREVSAMLTVAGWVDKKMAYVLCEQSLSKYFYIF